MQTLHLLDIYCGPRFLILFSAFLPYGVWIILRYSYSVKILEHHQEDENWPVQKKKKKRRAMTKPSFVES